MAELLDQYLGDFAIEGHQLPGQVTLKGKNSKFEIFSDLPIALDKDKMRTIRGVARAGEKITICDAIGAEVIRRFENPRKTFSGDLPVLDLCSDRAFCCSIAASKTAAD